MLTTIGLRLVLTTPFYAYQQRCQAKAELLLPELREWAASVQYKELTLAKRKGLSEAEAIKIANDATKVRVLAVFWPFLAAFAVFAVFVLVTWFILGSKA